MWNSYAASIPLILDAKNARNQLVPGVPFVEEVVLRLRFQEIYRITSLMGMPRASATPLP